MKDGKPVRSGRYGVSESERGPPWAAMRLRLGRQSRPGRRLAPDPPDPPDPPDLPELAELTATLAELRAELAERPASAESMAALPELTDLMVRLAELRAELTAPAPVPSAGPGAGPGLGSGGVDGTAGASAPSSEAAASPDLPEPSGSAAAQPEPATPADQPAPSRRESRRRGSSARGSTKRGSTQRRSAAQGSARQRLPRRVVVAAVAAGCAVVSSNAAQPLVAVPAGVPAALPSAGEALVPAGLATDGWQVEDPVAQRAELGALLSREQRQQAESLLGAWRPATSAAVTATGLANPLLADLPDARGVEVARTAVAFALAQIGKPYRWGAQGPDAYDCSGLTRRSYAAAGIGLPRTSAEQATAGRPVRLADLMPGDLVFWAYNPRDIRTVHHVALYLGGGLLVQAPEPGGFVGLAWMWLDGYAGAVRVVQGGNGIHPVDPATGAPVGLAVGSTGTPTGAAAGSAGPAGSSSSVASPASSSPASSSSSSPASSSSSSSAAPSSSSTSTSTPTSTEPAPTSSATTPLPSPSPTDTSPAPTPDPTTPDPTTTPAPTTASPATADPSSAAPSSAVPSSAAPSDSTSSSSTPSAAPGNADPSGTTSPTASP